MEADNYELVTCVRIDSLTVGGIEETYDAMLLEMFGSGTAVVISPISRVGFIDKDINIPTMKQPQPVYQRIKDTLLAIQYGHIEHPYSVVVS